MPSNWWDEDPVVEYSDEALEAVRRGANNSVRQAAGGAMRAMDVGAGAGMAARYLPAAGGATLRAAASPVGGAIVGGGLRAVSGGDALDIAEGATAGAGLGAAARVLKYVPGASRSLGARLMHMLGRAGKEEIPAAQKAAEATAAVAPRAASVVMPEGRVVGNAAQSIAEKQIAEAARRAATAPRATASAAPRPVRPIPPTQKPPTASAPRPGPVEEMTPLEGQLKASVLPKAEMALEVEKKVLALKTTQGLSNAQVTAALRELYGIPPSYGKKMVEMILQTHGLK